MEPVLNSHGNGIVSDRRSWTSMRFANEAAAVLDPLGYLTGRLPLTARGR